MIPGHTAASFDRGSGTSLRNFTLPSNYANGMGRFGESVALAGDRVIIGAPYAWNAMLGGYIGGVFVFRASTGSIAMSAHFQPVCS